MGKKYFEGVMVAIILTVLGQIKFFYADTTNYL